MSKIFYDHLIAFSEVEKTIKEVSQTKEEMEELWNLVDKIIHHRVINTILSKLPEAHHEEFIEMVYKYPHDERHFVYLKEQTGQDVETSVKEELEFVEIEILRHLGKQITNKSKKKK